MNLFFEPENLAIAVRGYVPVASKPKFKGKPPRPPSEWAVVFDTETATDAAQKLRIGAYQIRKSGAL